MDNFYSTLSPILRLFQFFGFSPHCIRQTSSSVTEIHRSWRMTIQTIIMFFIIFIHFAYMLYLLIFLIKLETASAVVVAAWMLGILIINTLIYIQAWFVSGRQIKLIYQYAKIDQLIRANIHSVPNYALITRKRIRKIFSELCITMVGLPLFWLIWFLMPAARIYIKHLLVPPIFMTIRLVHIIFFLNLLIENLQFINQRLIEIENHSNIEWKLILISKMKNNDDDDDETMIRLKKPSLRITEIKILRQIYGQIWKASLQLNDYFGGSILLLLIYYWLDIFTVVYFIFVILVGIYKQSMFCEYKEFLLFIIFYPFISIFIVYV